MVEALEGKVEVLLASDDGNKAFGVEFLGPGFDWRSNGVRFEEVGFGFDSGEKIRICITPTVTYTLSKQESINNGQLTFIPLQRFHFENFITSLRT
ncbi:hypothetical protein L2E82_07658 [Cichorium intybus]|uniref:Uncharacterized protein n=1 Tax=Cichorium intybus TaxID=13427 RepID=A0ACB9G5M2_CICIN|nr:hypothetical protein L2E82_07658 [Cichorium intybus]